MTSQPSRLIRILSLASILALSLLLTACKQGEVVPEGPQRVENQAMGFVLTDLASGCALTRNEGADLELSCSLDGEQGTMVFELGDEERGVNLLEKAKAQKEWYLAQPAGEFLGNRELVTPVGAAYTARGRYSAGGEAVEESRVLTLHPDKRHAILIRYRYSPGDRPATQDRMDQLLYVVGEISALDAPTEADAVPGGADSPAESPDAVEAEGQSPADS